MRAPVGVRIGVGVGVFLAGMSLLWSGAAPAATNKPVLHGRHWVAITGKPLAATAGAMMFQKGGNAVDAACAMLAATATMWDTLGWGGETQALIYNPKTGKVVALNALGRGADGRDAGVLPEPEAWPTRRSTGRSPPSRPGRRAGSW